jgi:hypothetical protein
VPPRTATQIDLLGVEEEALVKAAKRRECRLRDDEERAHRPVALALPFVGLGLDDLLAAPPQGSDRQGVAPVGSDARKAPERVNELPAVIDLAGREEMPPGTRVAFGDQRGQAACADRRVGIEEQDVARVAYVRTRQRTVTGPGESLVAAGHEHQRETHRDRCGAVVRAGIGHDKVKIESGCTGKDGREAVLQVAGAVVRDDDDAEIVAHEAQASPARATRRGASGT